MDIEEAQRCICKFLTHTVAQKKHVYKTIDQCREFMISISRRIQESHAHTIIAHKMFIESINTLHTCETQLTKIPQMPLQSALHELVKTQKKLWNIARLSGFSSVKDVLSFMDCEEEHPELLFYSKFFNAISMSVVSGVIKTRKLKLRVHPLQPTDIQVATNLLLHVHGAELHIECDSAVLKCKGYFSPCILNIPGFFFRQKLIHLRTSMVEVSDVPAEFVSGFIKQLSLAFFCTHSVSEIIQECSKQYQKIQTIKGMTISSLVKQFLTATTIEKRETILLLLLNNDDSDTEHLAYLLYDMISNKAYVMSSNQCADDIFNSLHWTVQDKLKQQLVITNKKIDEISQDMTDVFSYEKLILMLKAPDSVKAKAMTKLKEIKNGKGSDVTKASQYLDGLLKIPFGIYKREPITYELSSQKASCQRVLNDMPEFTHDVYDILQSIKEHPETLTFYTIEDVVLKYLPMIQDYIDTSMEEDLSSFPLTELKAFAKDFDVKTTRLRKGEVLMVLQPYAETIMREQMPGSNALRLMGWLKSAEGFVAEWIDYGKRKCEYISKVDTILDSAVYGLTEAKSQIKRIIAQWINGKDRGYVFGFEGPPGTGKTTLAKQGIAECLQDVNGEKRPFVFIALGGSTNGSTLEGHNYTYVGSTWGKIVDALMTAKCMNPIIYIDELDKISNTEHGREIIGILIHLTDPAQNEEFSDRYFSGIDIDLSKCLIIFSYNDASKVDRILLDRIHRIKTKPLDKYEKTTIIQNYVLPEMMKTIGFNMSDITLSEDVIHYLITTYTFEAGVRKVKEKLFHILRHINLHVLMNSENFTSRPVEITRELVDDILQNQYKHRIKSITKHDRIGVANGLYATASGVGGLTMIQIFPVFSEKSFSLKMTGQQGDVMKESISVAQTVAWHLLTMERQKVLEQRENWGLHLHCPETSTPKDGPSAGGVLTVAFLSMYTDQPVNRECAMTGEIDLLGNIMPIGGLVSKIEGARVAGAKIVLIPRDNEEDYEKIKRDTPQFVENEDFRIVVVDTIYDVLGHMFKDKKTLDTYLREERL
jgi:ATP-dependent Lon protease